MAEIPFAAYDPVFFAHYVMIDRPSVTSSSGRRSRSPQFQSSAHRLWQPRNSPSGATAVQIVYCSHRGSREIEHLGSAHSGSEVELLKAAARQRLAAGQGELDLGLDTSSPGGPLPITASRMGVLLDALGRAYRVPGFAQASGGDAVFAQLVLARIIEPVSKPDSLRVLEEAGEAPASYPTVNRRLRAYARDSWRQKDLRGLRRPCRAGPGEPGAL